MCRTLFNVGSSQSWPDVLKEMTGNTNIDAEALLEYFKPLHSWLEEANKMANDCIGWEGKVSNQIHSNTDTLRRFFTAEIHFCMQVLAASHRTTTQFQLLSALF